MTGRNSQTGDRDALLLDMLGKGLTGRFQTLEDRAFSELLTRLDRAADNDRRGASSRSG
jgi:hypothetical protein